jgi:hypothetical protein
LRVTAGDLEYECGRAFSLARPRSDDPRCVDAADDRKAWVLGGGVVVGSLGMLAIGARSR